MNDYSLRTYEKKRNTNVSPEPRASKRPKASHSDNTFVIQKHAAQSLHYDFRLGIAGVLKSWAIPKGLSEKIGEKRLAVRTEDHPPSYASFEGVIPKGYYGGGTVMVWDQGNFELISDPEKKATKTARQTLKEGTVKINLKGKKIRGHYALIRIKKTVKKEQWIIFKVKDEGALHHNLKDQSKSVLSDRSLEEITRQAGEKRHE